MQIVVNEGQYWSSIDIIKILHTRYLSVTFAALQIPKKIAFQFSSLYQWLTA